MKKIGLVKKPFFMNNVLVGSKIKLGNNTLLERPTEILHPLEIYSDVVNNEDQSFTRNKNETYETWISNISNLDKVDESKDAVVTNNCIKINADKENNRDAKY